MSTQFSIYPFKTSSTSPKEQAHQRLQEILHLYSKEEVERLRPELRSPTVPRDGPDKAKQPFT